MPSVLSNNWRVAALANGKEPARRTARPTAGSGVERTTLGDSLDEDTKETVKFIRMYNRFKEEQEKVTDGLKAEIEELRKEIATLKTSPISSITSTRSGGTPCRARSFEMQEETPGAAEPTTVRAGKGIVAPQTLAQQHREAEVNEARVKDMIADLLPHLKGAKENRVTAVGLE